jgi:iron complex transport system ATP-binding protein
MNLLGVDDIYFGYGKENLLNGINIDLKEGQVLCLFGPNGCGKTTLLDCILGLNKIRNGKITIYGINLEQLKSEEIAKMIAYVPQKHNRTFPYSVMEIVLMGRTAYTSMFSSPGEEDYILAEEALKKVGMYEFKDRVFTSLSGGEVQLIKIARALAQGTKILIFDEPTSHLDFSHEIIVLKTIIRLIKSQEIAIIMASHSPNHAYFLENSGVDTFVAIMNNGVFEKSGRPSDILNEENMKRIFKVKTKVLEHNKMRYMVPLDLDTAKK